jgi:hypothetical protein
MRLSESRKLDVLSLLLLAIGLAALEVALKEAPTRSCSSILVTGLLVITSAHREIGAAEPAEQPESSIVSNSIAKILIPASTGSPNFLLRRPRRRRFYSRRSDNYLCSLLHLRHGLDHAGRLNP